MPEDHRDLTPDETERVRRLLADARHTDPAPPDVVARLDHTLASLAQERQGRDERAVTALASRRRRSVVNLLVAAVAVVAVGVGLGEVMSGVGSGGDDAGGSSSTADEGSAAGGSDAPAEGAPPTGGSSSRSVPRLDGGTFDADVQALRGRGTDSQQGLGPTAGESCERPAWGEGRRVVVRYDGATAALVFREPVGAAQRVDLFRCDADAPLRSTTVPAP